jgi:hypothetical protein
MDWVVFKSLCRGPNLETSPRTTAISPYCYRFFVEPRMRANLKMVNFLADGFAGMNGFLESSSRF